MRKRRERAAEEEIAWIRRWLEETEKIRKRLKQEGVLGGNPADPADLPFARLAWSLQDFRTEFRDFRSEFRLWLAIGAGVLAALLALHVR